MIYEWIDHPFLWAVRIRPAELFDQATVDEFPTWEEWEDPNVDGRPMGSLRAVHVLTGLRERYIAIYDKRCYGFHEVEDEHEGEDRHGQRDRRQLAQLPPERWEEFYRNYKAKPQPHNPIGSPGWVRQYREELSERVRERNDREGKFD